MRRVLLVCAAASLAIGLTTSNTTAQEKGKWARGKVTAMAGDTLTVDVKGEPMSFTVDKSTQVLKTGAGTKAREMAKTGEAPTLTDVLKVGDEVEVHYTESGGKMHATTVRAGVSAPSSTSEDQPRRVEGVVTSVSDTSLSIKRKTGAAMTFTIGTGTKVVGEGLGTLAREKGVMGAMKFTDTIKPGETVEVEYKTEDGKMHARTVTVLKKTT
jgi:uncharacterized protein DUF5666